MLMLPLLSFAMQMINGGCGSNGYPGNNYGNNYPGGSLFNGGYDPGSYYGTYYAPDGHWYA
ncbi:MAG: hypothetical protein V2B14_04340 [bacterium]